MALFNQIIGTQSDNLLTTTNGQDIVLASGGNDRIIADFNSVDYIIGGDGQDTVAVALPHNSFSITAHPGITDGYIVRYTGTNGKIVANIVKGVEIFEFTEGSITLQDFLAGKPLNGGQEPTEINLDGRGTIDNHETVDAGTADFLYKDNLSISDYVVINNFSKGDKLEITADQDDIISIANDGEDVIITNNSSSAGNTVINSITLVGVVSSNNIISDEATFEQAIGFDALTINII